MVRLIAPNGAIVSVSEEKAERLAAHGFKPAETPAPAPKKPAARKPSATKSE